MKSEYVIVSRIAGDDGRFPVLGNAIDARESATEAIIQLSEQARGYSTMRGVNVEWQKINDAEIARRSFLERAVLVSTRTQARALFTVEMRQKGGA